MTNEELVQLYQDGDNKALEQLLEDNKGLIRKIAYKFYTENTASVDIDDLIQEGSIGLIMAAKKYKFELEKKAKFSTYAIYWVYKKINHFMKYRNTNEETSLNKPYGNDDEGTELVDTLSSEDYEYCKVEDSVYYQQLHKEIHEAAYKNLTLQQRQVIFLRYGFGCKAYTLKEVGEVFKLSIERIRQIEVSSLKRLRACKWGRIKEKELIEEFGYVRLKVRVTNYI
nr:sigma-70 family RNA polymerase sigma factor [uncultured Cellulosilyticum sp.]